MIWLLGLALILLLALVLTLLLLPVWKQQEQRLCYQICMMLGVGSLALYAIVGSPRIITPLEEYHAEVEALQEQVVAMSKLLEAHPENLDAWLTLAQAFLDLGEYGPAVHGFKQAVLISKGQPRIITAYAEAMILQAEGQVTDEAKRSLDIALMLDATLPLARYYRAIWRLQHGQQETAMREMKALYQELPESSSLKKRMRSEIGR